MNKAHFNRNSSEEEDNDTEDENEASTGSTLATSAVTVESARYRSTMTSDSAGVPISSSSEEEDHDTEDGNEVSPGTVRAKSGVTIESARYTTASNSVGVPIPSSNEEKDNDTEDENEVGIHVSPDTIPAKSGVTIESAKYTTTTNSVGVPIHPSSDPGLDIKREVAKMMIFVGVVTYMYLNKDELEAQAAKLNDWMNSLTVCVCKRTMASADGVRKTPECVSAVCTRWNYVKSSFFNMIQQVFTSVERLKGI